MYSLVSAIGKPLGAQHKWIAVDITSLSMQALYTTYRSVYVTLSNPFLTDVVSLDLSLIQVDYEDSALTFPQVLTSLGDQSLPTQVKVGAVTTHYANYRDAIQAQYHIQPVNPDTSFDATQVSDDKTWLHMTRTDAHGVAIDYKLFFDHCLVSVNGFYHFVDYDSSGIYVLDGMKSVGVCNQANAGILSFLDIGTIQCLPITEAMLYKQDDTVGFKDRVFVDTGIDLSNKSVIVSIGGYLNLIDGNQFFRTGTNQLGIDMANYGLLNRFYESRQYLDYSDFPLSTTDLNDTQFAISELYSDAFITKLMTMSQSFVVIIDNPDIYAELEAIRKQSMPGAFISYENPVYPVLVGQGMVAEYWSEGEELGQWLLECTDNRWQRRVYNTTDPKVQHSVSDSRIPSMPIIYSRGAFLKVSYDSVKNIPPIIP